MKGTEIQYAKSSVFREATEQLVDLCRLIVPDNEELRHVSIDVQRHVVIVMMEEEVENGPSS